MTGTSSTTTRMTTTFTGDRATDNASRLHRGASNDASTPGDPNGRQNSRSPISSASGGISVIVASNETSSENASTGPSMSAGANLDANSAKSPKIVTVALDNIPGMV